MKKSIIFCILCACASLLFWQCNKETLVEKVEYQKGNTIHYGNGAPTADRGSIGDYYFDITYSDLYGAKTESGWGYPISLRGEKGDLGEKGERGDKGQQGDKGDKGETGDKGDKGDKGVAGDKGETGEKGKTGDKGEQGDKGAVGEKGENGSKGEKGNSRTRIFLKKGRPYFEGKDGDWCIDTETGVIYGYKEDCSESNYGCWEAVLPDFEVSQDKKTLIKCNKKDLTEVNLGNIPKLKHITSIGKEAFWGCYSLTTITIPNGVTRIEEGAFWGCTSLTTITIPNGVTSIGKKAFRSCSSLTTITIPNSVTHIKREAFSGCSALTSIAIPSSVTRIEYSAFQDCTALTSITIPNSVTNIEGFAFKGCSALTSIAIPNYYCPVKIKKA